MPPPPPLTLTWVGSATAIPSTLWQRCFPPPLEGAWWYTTLEESDLGDQFTFLYAVIRRHDTPIAIAPAFLMDLPISLVVPPALLPLLNLLGKAWPTLLHQRTLFVGSPCADAGHVGILPEEDPLPILHLLQQELLRRMHVLHAAMLVWKDFPAAFDAPLTSMLSTHGLFRVTSFPGTCVTLPGPDKQAYLAALSGMRRHNLRKKLRKSSAAVALDIQVLKNPDASQLDAITALFTQTYNKAKTRFERLDRPFFARIAREPQAYFVTLHASTSKEMVAFMLCFDGGDLLINKFIGIDYRRPRDWFLYFRLWDAVVDWALSRGMRAIQSGQTGYTAKIRLGHALIPLTNYARHRNPLMHHIYAWVGRTVSWATLDAELTIEEKRRGKGEEEEG
ncbi:MAG: GNAT family N-acetyltransferase [Magnetococcales bacterium]|nr:GNAT family N-acetyltransferase [Magnetococcales bacterium]